MPIFWSHLVLDKNKNIIEEARHDLIPEHVADDRRRHPRRFVDGCAGKLTVPGKTCAECSAGADDGARASRHSQCRRGENLRGVRRRRFRRRADKLPIAQLKLPKGFKIEVYASGIANARSLRLGDKGTVFVSNRVLDKVYAVVDRNGKREAKVIASGLDRPNGLAFHNGTLYIARGHQDLEARKDRGQPRQPAKPVVIYNDLPNHQSHGWKFIAIGPDHKLYINVGAPCNICVPPEENAPDPPHQSRRQRR